MDKEKYLNYYGKFHTVVLLDELCNLSNAAVRTFTLDTCYRIDAIRMLILQRTKESSADKQL